MSRGAKINKWLEYSLIVVCFLAPLIVLVSWKKLEQSNDFAECYAASYLMNNYTYSLIYNHTFSIPPIISWIFVPLADLKVKMALYVWLAFAIVFMLSSCFTLCESLGVRGVKKLWTFALFGALGPCAMSICHEQLSPLLLFALTGLFVTLKKRSPILASTYQFLLWLKPYLLIPLIVCELGAGQTVLVVVSFLLAVIGLLLSCVSGGVGCIQGYGHQLVSAKIETSLLSLLHASAIPNRVLNSAPLLDLYSAISIVVYLILIGMAFIVGRQIKAKKLKPAILFTFLIPLTLCLFSKALVYDLLLISPGILLFIVSKASGWLKYVKIIIVIGLFAVLLLPNYLIICSLGISKNGFLSPFFWVTLLFAIGSLAIEKYSGLASMQESE